jgi:hypothetical protein
MVKIPMMVLWVITKLGLYALCLCKIHKLLAILYGGLQDNSKFKLGTQNEGNCLIFIIRLSIIC